MASSSSAATAAAGRARLPTASSPLSLSLLLLSVERLSYRYPQPAEAAAVLIRDFAEPIKRWTEERRLRPLRDGLTDAAMDDRRRRAAARSDELSTRHSTEQAALLALSRSLARWERQKEQYGLLRETLGPLLTAEEDKQRQWQSTARRLIEHDGATSSDSRSVRSPRLPSSQMEPGHSAPLSVLCCDGQ